MEMRPHPAWLLQTRASSMLVHIGPEGTVFVPHWGANGGSTRPEDYLPTLPANRASEAEFFDGQPLAYPAYGMPTFKETCLVVATEDGARGVRLEFASDQVDADSLTLLFRDSSLQLEVVLRFRVFEECDVVARSVELRNTGSQVLLLERALSAALPLPPDEYDAITLHGDWGREFEVHQQPLHPGRLSTGTTRGRSSHEAHPWFAVRPRGEQAEHTGRVWFGSLAWSGNWLLVFDVERNDALNVVMGIQTFDFGWRLEPGQTFETPELVCGYSERGIGGASRLLHRYEETVRLPANHRERLRPVLYNSWEATYFDVTADSQIRLAGIAADLGVELFVVDDGWFGARDHDRAGLGDWTVNPIKFPNGLRELIDEVHRLGMQFGIWVEPEMVNPDSDLFRAHPEWAYHATGRTGTLGRNQLVLNFARDDVREAIYAQLHALLSGHGRIDFVKWDHNRAWTEVGWPEQPLQQREVWGRHVFGLWEVLGRLREAFPHLLIESCAGGGGRADLGMLRWTDQVWTSDNTDAADRLAIQYGYSRAHSPRVMVNWVTDVPNHQTGRVSPLEFRFHVAMQGVLGIGGDISEWPTADLATAARLVSEYKQIRPLVQFGRQYWLRAPAPIGLCGVQYVSADRLATVVMLYQVRGAVGQGERRMHLHGLDHDRRYRRDDGAESTGAALMAAGIPARLRHVARHPELDWRSRIEMWRAVS
jgi:alpha-galactosidase